MNARRTRKTWKKFQAEMLGEPSGFGAIIPGERRAAMEYWVHAMNQLARAAKVAARSLQEVNHA